MKPSGSAAHQFAHPIDAPARFLDRDDVRAIFRQPNDRVGGDIDAAASRNVVEHELERGRLGDRGEMPEKSFLARLVVIGRDEERAIRADFLRFLRVRDRVAGRVGAGAGDHLAAPARHLHREFDYVVALSAAQGRRFAGRPDRHDAGDSTGDLRFDQTLESFDVDFVIFERGDERRVNVPRNIVRFGET